MCRSIGSTQIAIQERICKSRKPFLAVEFCIQKNTVKSGKYNLTILFSVSFCIAKPEKVILRVKINPLKIYPQNNRCHFSDSFLEQYLHHQNDKSHFSDANNSYKKYHQINKSYFNDTCEVRCL